ncbi:MULTISPECIES: LysR family transcriptional regulator [Stappiaceae]|jgi:DNA-binding transcriptional LysR family regulator|uniref:HTH-type transcriptional regulator GltC n=2 Tax=Roseibium TaxID=150830 RepID=A0A0M6XZ77_9HYPH|nr:MULTISPECIES: LysR family transcriptional regulator [Stappiaceae]MEC9404531.1 LysR family transcriptional regulator [Pseudomonadota bacterium]AQQ06699.1 transcriptional regulator [Roseibium aggregatum]ERP98049.1 transcriptional regulator [Labrenzia sp. C1B10]ERS01841.1 transcriptional regulator [Labrenzia sp. C1B70]MBO6859279.1 LysR family transcriptional regulator [Roseibium sp.]
MRSGRAQDLSRNLYSPAMRYFLAVAEAGSIRAASRELNVASSAINRQVLWLEEALGLQLFDRVGRRLRLSQAGELLLAHIRRTYSDFEGTVAELDALKGLRRGTVSIASVESVAEKLLPAVISTFRKSYPGIHVNVSISSSREAARKVEAAEADVGFTFDPPETSALTTAFHHDLVIGALMRPDHPLAGAKTLGLQDCLKYPVALPAEGLSLRTRLDIVRSRIPGASRTYVEANSLRLMRALAREEQVIGFQTMIGCEDDLANGFLIFKPLSDTPLQADRLCVVTSSLRALALAPGMFFDHAVFALRDQLSALDAK